MSTSRTPLLLVLLVSLVTYGCKHEEKASSIPVVQPPTASAASTPPAPSEEPTKVKEDTVKPTPKPTSASRFTAALALSGAELTKVIWRGVGADSSTCDVDPNSYYDDVYLFYAVTQAEKTMPWIACKISKGIPGTTPVVPGNGLLELLETISPEKIYVKGPYRADGVARLMGKDASEGDVLFGHYNPKFVRWLTDNAIPGAQDEAFRKETQVIYDKYFKETARIYAESYQKAQKNRPCFEEQKASYAKHLSRERIYDFNYEPWDQWLAEKDICNRSSEVSGEDRTERNILIAPEGMAFSFWVRRDIDGTGVLWYEGLQKLRLAYEK